MFGPHKISDPDRLVLRRSCRVAVVIPLAFWFVQIVLGIPNASLATAFASITILMFADFGGPLRQRLVANVILGVAGLVLVVVGSVVATLSSYGIFVTFLIGFGISFAGVLRGYFGAGVLAALVPLLYAVTQEPDLGLIPERCLGWFVGVVAATVGASMLWPTHPRSELRRRVAAAINCLARCVHATWVEPDPSGAWRLKLTSSMSAVHSAYDGKLLRPGGGTSRDRALILSIDQVERLATVLLWRPSNERPLRDVDIDLARATATALEQSAGALLGETQPPDPGAMDSQREHHAQVTEEWVEHKLSTDRTAIVAPALATSFHVRLASMSAQVLSFNVGEAVGLKAANARGSAPQDAETLSSEPLRALEDRMTVADQLRWNFGIRSPWTRMAFRTGIALALAVLVVHITGVQHGFWVALGVLVALKFDVSGTKQIAWRVAVGTIAGFILGSALVIVAGSHNLVFWVVMPIALFLASYTPGLISLVLGQASFTVFIVALYAIYDPDGIKTGEIRLQDVLLGLAVSLLVSLLMWPHGVAPLVARTMKAAAAASCAYLIAAYDRLIVGSSAKDQLQQAASHAEKSVEQAAETFDLAFSQLGPGLTDFKQWASVTNCTTQLVFGAHVVAALARVGKLPPDSVGVQDTLIATAHRLQSRVAEAVDSVALIGGSQPGASVATMSELESQATAFHEGDPDVAHLNAAMAAYMESWRASDAPAVGREIVTLAFAAGWLVHSLWLAQYLSEIAAMPPAGG